MAQLLNTNRLPLLCSLSNEFTHEFTVAEAAFANGPVTVEPFHIVGGFDVAPFPLTCASGTVHEDPSGDKFVVESLDDSGSIIASHKRVVDSGAVGLESGQSPLLPLRTMLSTRRISAVAFGLALLTSQPPLLVGFVEGRTTGNGDGVSCRGDGHPRLPLGALQGDPLGEPFWLLV